MGITLIDHMGSDLSVVDAARVSFANKGEWEFDFEDQYNGFIKRKKRLGKKDVRLINYLSTHGHWSPFAHTSVSIRIKAPLFVAAQLKKHQVGLSWNEVSRRYVDSDPEFYIPKTWRGRPTDKKQGSSDVEIKPEPVMVDTGLGPMAMTRDALLDIHLQIYRNLIKQGIAPEQARMDLPQSMYTEWIWTGSMLAFSRICNLRCALDTQLETQEIGNQIDAIVGPLFPVSWGALRDA